MSEGARSKKRNPSWLTGAEPEEITINAPSAHAGAQRRGPLAEAETGELPTAEQPSVHHSDASPAGPDARTRTVPRISVPGAKERTRDGGTVGGGSTADILKRLRQNPVLAALALLMVLVLVAALWFLFLRAGGGAGEDESAAGSEGAGPSSEDPFGGGSVRDTGVIFGALEQDDEEATLEGAGLSWSGAVTEKEGEAGETLTLEGPTAAQLERGFDLGSSGVESGVYAVAQEGGEVLHVTTHSFVPDEGEEMTLGTVYSIQDGKLAGYAYYLDRREPGTDTITRAYVRPGQSTYRVSFQAPAQATADGQDRAGTFVPLLVGWRGFDDSNTHE